MSKKTEQINIKVTEEEKQSIAVLATDLDMTPSSLILKAVEFYSVIAKAYPLFSSITTIKNKYLQQTLE